MADTDQAAAEVSADSREIRVFLSSTFRDFNEERRLLATQVFPRLNRQARERGVELVEVDLRWGVTQEQAEDGHALEICLKQIERCQPYFIGMLGDSYGSITPPERKLLKGSPELLAKRQWLAGRIGEASYTELEIEHSLQLLRDPAIAGKAFFYFRDPAYSTPKAEAGEAGWRSDPPEDRQKLELLRKKIRGSGFPRTEGLKDPQALVDQIEKDLWALIDQQFPEGEQPDALEKEARKHADYRRSRTGAGQYIGGEAYIQQLERWLEAGEQQILITGESGAGKSALIANWMEAHQQNHPGDVIYAHHLGCTNDANALRPLLGRLIDTASAQLLDAEVITEPLAVPEDWWELVAKVAETLQNLGRWCEQHGKRWIWVLDGLDRLDEDDQKALPWLPQSLPAGVQVVASALACSARSILSERGYTTLTIEPLATAEQEQLIQRYLERYTKELDGGLRQQILGHKLAGSPLFLKVLLEELRQCGRHDTLKSQLDFYLSSQTIDDLYERVLERLENDGSGDAVRKVMTAIWASRAGLTETELLDITDLKPLQWAPIDLALEKAFGRNGNRLVFDHDYLRNAVKDRFLPTKKQIHRAYSDLADYWLAKSGCKTFLEDRKVPEGKNGVAMIEPDKGSGGEWDELMGLLKRQFFGIDRSESVITNKDVHIDGPTHNDYLNDACWSLLKARRLEDCITLLKNPEFLLPLIESAGSKEVIQRFYEAGMQPSSRYDEVLSQIISTICSNAKNGMDGVESAVESASTIRKLCELADCHGLDVSARKALFEARALALELEERIAITWFFPLEILGGMIGALRDYGIAKAGALSLYRVLRRRFTSEFTTTLLDDMALGAYSEFMRTKDKGFYLLSMKCVNRSLRWKRFFYSRKSLSYTRTLVTKATLFQGNGNLEKSRAILERCLVIQKEILPDIHPCMAETLWLLASNAQSRGDIQRADSLYIQAIEVATEASGEDDDNAIAIASAYSEMLSSVGRNKEAVFFQRREVAWFRIEYGENNPRTLISINELAIYLRDAGELEEAEALFLELLTALRQVLEPDDFQIGRAIGGLAKTLEAAGKLEEALTYSQQALDHRQSHEGPDAWWTNRERLDLARVLQKLGRSDQALSLLDQLLMSMKDIIEPDDSDRKLMQDAEALKQDLGT